MPERLADPRAFVHLLKTCVFQVVPKQFLRQSQDNAGVGTQSDEAEQFAKPVELERVTLADWFSSLAWLEAGEGEGGCLSAIRSKELVMKLQHFLISQATSTYTTTVSGTESGQKPFQLNLYLQKPKPDAPNQKMQVVRSGDGDCNLPFWGRILDLKAVCQFSSKAFSSNG